MTLGTSQGVTDLCKSVDTDLIDRMLVKARARLTARLLKEGLTTPATSVDLDTAVEAIAAGLIAIGPGAVDPRTGFTVDGFSRKDGSDSQIKEFKDIADESIADYVATQLTASPIPGMSVVGREGQRIGEFEEMTEEQEGVY